MDRLTMTNEEMEEIRQYSPDFDCPVKAEEGSLTNLFCDHVCDEFQHDCPFMKIGQKLKEYEDAEEQGLLLRLPMTEGTEVYVIVEAYSFGEVGDEAEKWFSIHKDRFSRNMIEEFGKTVFLTKEEAEQALANMKAGAENE